MGRITLAKERFDAVLSKIENCKSDQEKAIVAFDLLEEYRAFRSERHSERVFNIIKKTYSEIPKHDQCTFFTLDLLKRARYAIAMFEGWQMKDEGADDIGEMIHDGIWAYKEMCEQTVKDTLDDMYDDGEETDLKTLDD